MAFFQAALRGSLRRAYAGVRAASRSPAVESLGSSRSSTCIALAAEEATASQSTLLRFGTTLGLGFAAVGAAMSSGPVAHCATVEAPEAPPATGTETSQGTKTTVVFVLGGPGSGKGTQCGKIVSEFPDVAHFSAGDLLRAHVKSGSEEGNKVAEMMQQGQIVPSSVTVGLLQEAMKSSGKTKFLIDGFPRNVENRQAFEDCTGSDCDFVMFFDCPEDVMEKRLLGRNEGRADDNIETIRKRFKVFVESSMPVIDYYGKLDKLYKIQATRDPNDVYTDVRRLFM